MRCAHRLLGREGGSAASRATADATLHASTLWDADLVSYSPLQLSTNSLGHKIQM